MKISKNQMNEVIKAYLKATRTEKPSQTGTAKVEKTRMDSVALSSDAQRLADYVNLAKSLPEVRKELVEEISRRLDSGEYNIGSHEIAEKMLARDLADRLE
ncbi:MAG: flagellar biosynthesis anti-sigma factor FlgM [Bacillota bacterium]